MVNKNKRKQKYKFRFVFLGFAVICCIILIIAWLTTGRTVISYYNFCSDKTNYAEIELQFSIVDGEICFKDTRGITGHGAIQYDLIEDNAETAKNKGILNDLNEGDNVTVTVAPIKLWECSITGIKKDNKTYLSFDEGYENWLKVCADDKEYFYSGTTTILILGLIGTALFVLFHILSVRNKKRNKLEEPTEDKKKKVLPKYWFRYIFLAVFSIMFLFCMIVFMLFGPDVIQYKNLSKKDNYKEVTCRVVNNDGYKDLIIIDDTEMNYRNTIFNLSEENAEIAYGRGLNVEIEIDDIVTVIFINGTYHGTPYHIAGIKKGDKIYLDFNDGYENLLKIWRDNRKNSLIWLVTSFGVWGLNIGLFIIFEILNKKHKRINLKQEQKN